MSSKFGNKASFFLIKFDRHHLFSMNDTKTCLLLSLKDYLSYEYNVNCLTKSQRFFFQLQCHTLNQIVTYLVVFVWCSSMCGSRK